MPLPMYNPEKNKPSHLIGIAAGKGGVGKSTTAVNLALSLQKKGFTVGILDADLYGPSLQKMLPETAPPRQEGEILFPAESRGIKLMSISYFRSEEKAQAVRAPIANSIITQFIRNVAWGPLDFLLIDFPPGTGDIQITLAQKAELTGAILVTTPQEISLLDVRKAAHLFQMVNVPLLGVIENMAYYKDPKTGVIAHPFGKGGGQKLASELQLPLIGSLPLDPNLSEASDCGVSLFETAPSSEAAKAFESIAMTLTSFVNNGQEKAKSLEINWK